MKNCKTSNPTALRSKALLKEAAVALMGEGSLAEASVGEICARAQLTRPTFYNHFETKQDLAAAIVDDVLEEFAREVQRRGIESTEDMLICFLGFWEERWDLLALMESNGLIPLIGERFTPHLERIYATSSFTDKDRGPQELSYHNAFLSGGVVGMLRRWARGDARPTAAQLAHYMENMLDSLSAGMKRSRL